MKAECKHRVSFVIDTRESKVSGYFVRRRRRRCQYCDARFSTYEVSHERYKILLEAERFRKAARLIQGDSDKS